MNHCSTIQERVSMVSHLLANPMHGQVSQLSRTHRVSRQTLYRWAATGRQALEEALGERPVPAKQKEAISLMVLTLLMETHASYRGIQTCLRELHGLHLSLGSISGIVKEAGQRAQRWLSQQQASTPRALALDEQYSSQRGKGYLNVIDVHSGQVWATVPPVEVDGESWTVLLWYLQEQGISRLGTVSDGGRAIQEALSQVQGQEQHQRDVWHLFHVAAAVQGRLDRAVQAEQARLLSIQLQAEALANGRRRRGRHPKASLAEQEVSFAQMSYLADAVRYLYQQLHTLLEVVVPLPGGLLCSEDRQGELLTVLDLLDELVPSAPPAVQGQMKMLARQVRLALPQTCCLRDDWIRCKSKPALSWVRRRWLCWGGPGCVGLCLVRRANTCCKAFPLPGEKLPLAFWRPGIKPFAPVVPWKIGIALFGHIWRYIANFRLGCFACSRFGIITRSLLAVFMRVFLPYNGRDRPHPIFIGWPLWGILPMLPDCSQVSHGFEPCQIINDHEA